MCIGIASSLVASLVFAALTLFTTEWVRTRRAKPFTGRYRMFGPDGSEPTGGIVRIERTSWVENLLSSAPILSVFAEHGSRLGLGAEDWSGSVEVLGLSKTASGYFWYRNQSGGALRP
jgi:hypothetical protein